MTDHGGERVGVTTETADDLLAIEDLAVGYKAGPDVLKGISITVPRSGAVGVVGANGAGKTTLVRSITGLLSFHGGRVRSGRAMLRGRETTSLAPHQIVRLGVAQVPEGRMLFNHLTVEENLRIGALGASRQATFADSVAKVYDLFPILGERRRQQAGYMSGGEQQMIAIGRALMAQPSLMILDEVSLGLAPKIIADIVESLQQIRSELQTAFLVVEQNASVALELSDVIHIMERGRLVTEADSSNQAFGERIRGAYLGE